MERRKKGRLFAVLVTVAFLVICSATAVFCEKLEPVTVGWTYHTEDAIMGNMIAILIKENTHIPVKTVEELGGTGIAHQAIIEGKIDIYPDYTGDALCNVLKKEPISNPRKAWEAVRNGFIKRFNITWLEPTPFNNTYALAVRAGMADEYNLETISDSKPYAGDLIIGCSIEFSQREKDGYPGMIKAYGFKFKDVKPMNPGLMYKAAAEKEVDVIAAFATDARIGKFNLRVLKDNAEFFPCYNAAPTVRNEVMEKYPYLRFILNQVFKNLDTETMIALNGKVDIEGQEPAKVAQEFLKSQGYI
jgi:glycine betaine/choline ABC-type transport system substrate-binding protein